MFQKKIWSLLKAQTEHSGGPLGDPSARVFEVFLIVLDGVQGEGPGSWRERNDSENRASSLARLSPRLPRQREFMRHLFVVDSLDKQIQNEKELIHLACAGRGAILYLCGEYYLDLT